MYAGITIFHLRPEDIGEFDRLVADRLAEFKQLPGATRLLFLSDAATGKAAALALYETEAEVSAAPVSASYQRLLNLPELQALLARATEPVKRETLRVVAQL
ncbi:MAG TPA: hypothetical protein VFL91_20815 [Thermomicrobiales bacterium]|nr:hypothetical protein [Thermomicrobiales bacterium]